MRVTGFTKLCWMSAMQPVRTIQRAITTKRHSFCQQFGLVHKKCTAPLIHRTFNSCRGADRLYSTSTINGSLCLRHVMIQTNLEYFDERPQGVIYNVAYVDNCYGSDVSTRWQKPVALLLHGSPGTHQDMMILAQPLIDRGFRVIVPNFPGKLKIPCDYSQVSSKS